MPSASWSTAEPGLRAFISYPSPYAPAAAGLARALSGYGLACYLAPDEIALSEDWERELRSALRAADLGVAVIGAGFDASPWTNQEVGYLLGRGCPVFSVQLGGPPPGFLARLQGIEANGRPADDLARDLVRVVAASDVIGDRFLDGVEQRIGAVTSLPEAAQVITLVRLVGPWPAHRAARIRSFTTTGSYWPGSVRLRSLLDALDGGP